MGYGGRRRNRYRERLCDKAEIPYLKARRLSNAELRRLASLKDGAQRLIGPGEPKIGRRPYRRSALGTAYLGWVAFNSKRLADLVAKIAYKMTGDYCSVGFNGRGYKVIRRSGMKEFNV